MTHALGLEALFDGVLMGARERSEYELACVGMTGMDGKVVAGSDDGCKYPETLFRRCATCIDQVCAPTRDT